MSRYFTDIETGFETVEPLKAGAPVLCILIGRLPDYLNEALYSVPGRKRATSWA